MSRPATGRLPAPRAQDSTGHTTAEGFDLHAGVHAQAATLAGGSANQDAHVILDEAAGVLDGASAFPPEPPGRDGGWYARTLAEALTQRLPGHGQPLARLLADAIAHIRGIHDLDDTGPSATVLLTRWNPETVDVLALGDSTAVITTTSTLGPTSTCEPSEHQVLTDRRLDRLGVEHRRAYRAHLANGHGYGPTHTHRLAALQAEQHRGRNTSDGYWIAAADPQAAHHARIRSLPRASVSSILLLTDGATAAVETYHRPPTWSDYLHTAHTQGLAQLLRATHQIEGTDPHGHRWPRAKPHDDKTALLLSFTP